MQYDEAETAASHFRARFAGHLRNFPFEFDLGHDEHPLLRIEETKELKERTQQKKTARRRWEAKARC
jgi:hypothetical protein